MKYEDYRELLKCCLTEDDEELVMRKQQDSLIDGIRSVCPVCYSTISEHEDWSTFGQTCVVVRCPGCNEMSKIDY